MKPFNRQIYFEGKRNGKLDKEIAKEFEMSKDTLTRYKKIYDVKYTRTRKNKNGVTEMDIQKGIKNGIPRERILKRVNSGFSIERAVTEPVQKGKGVRKHGIH